VVRGTGKILMKRPIPVRSRAAVHAAFTLVEILMALALSLLLLGAVITMFGKVSESIGDSRSLLEMADRLRLAETRLQLDLAGATATMNPPRNPANNEGYFEYIEGPATTGSNIAVNTDNGSNQDTTVGDFDDILMFTTRSNGQPFVGRSGQSYVAEVAWFLRGRTLHRRVLLVMPGTITNMRIGSPGGFSYANSDVSVHLNSGTPATVTANTLADLTRRANRFAHITDLPAAGGCSNWTWMWKTSAGVQYTFPTLPTLDECCCSGWVPTAKAPDWIPNPVPYALGNSLDFWTTATGNRMTDYDLTASTSNVRVSDDIILTNVIGFDVKAWDPTQNAYVDLGYAGVSYASAPNGLGHLGDPNSQLNGTATTARVYDTWSTTYFGTLWNDGIDKDANGTANGIVDDDSEKTNPPPYPVPLRGIQVKIRVFEPDSKQIREVTVVQDFLPQ